MAVRLNLKKQYAGQYSNKVGGIEISVSNPSVDIGGRSEWQLIVTDDDQPDDEWVILNEWFPTKRSAYEFCVKWLMSREEG